MSGVFYSNGDVEISGAMARFGKTSYPVKNIGAVSVETKKTGYKTAGFIGVILGLVSLAFVTPLISIALIVLGVFFLFKKPTYEFQLVLATSSGNTQAYSSTDETNFDEIRGALEKAIAGKD